MENEPKIDFMSTKSIFLVISFKMFQMKQFLKKTVYKIDFFLEISWILGWVFMWELPHVKQFEDNSKRWHFLFLIQFTMGFGSEL